MNVNASLRPRGAAFLAVMLASASHAAHAQVGAAESPPAAGSPLQEAATQQAESGQIGEIIVTAQRRAENLQRVPIAITAMTSDTLEAANITGTQDIAMLTPGLNFNSVGGYGQPRIRGVGTTADTPSLENPIATYVDGVYYAHQGGSLLSLNNIERIEVLKGPQGTLFGRNATGGLIHIITRDPGQSLNGNFSVGVENYKTFSGNAYIGGGISEDIAADIAVYVKNQGDGYGKNILTGQEINKMNNLAARSKWVWKPSDGTKIVLTGDYARNSGAIAQAPAPGTTPLGGAPNLSGQDVAIPAPFRNTFNQGGASLRIEHDFGSIGLVSTSAYRTGRGTIFFPNVGQDPANLILVKLYDRSEQASQEFQLQSDTGSVINWTAGAFLFYAKGGWHPVDLSGGGLSPISQIFLDSDQTTYSGAIYGQSTFEVATGTKLTLGLRYTIDERKWKLAQSFVAPFPLGPFSDSGKRTFRKLTWRASLEHSFDAGVLIYASVNRGFKSGGFNDLTLPATPYLPETLDAFEIGVKSDLFDRHLRLNASSFYYDYKNLQVSRYSNGILLLYNGARAKVYGLDVDAEAAVSDRLHITAGLSLVHARYTSFLNADITTPAPGGGTIISTGSAKGNRLSYTPDWTVNLAVNYTVPLPSGSLEVNATYLHSDGFVGSPDERLRQKPYDTLNSSVAWVSADKNWKVSVYGRNLTNELYASALYAQANGDPVQYSAPRSYGVSVQRKF